mgnify:CR=1 FL=1
MTDRTPLVARWTGLAYLGIIGTGLFAELGVRAPLVVSGDAAATASHIAQSAHWFRLGILADVAMVGFDVAVAIGLLHLLQRVDKPLAQLAAALRLIQAAVISANLMNMVAAVQLAESGAAGAVPAPGGVLSAMQVHGTVYDIGLVFFGLACLVLGWLLHRSPSAPSVLGWSVAAAGVVYLVGSFSAVCAPAWSAALDPLYGVAFLAELAFAGWLVFGKHHNPATASVASAAA